MEELGSLLIYSNRVQFAAVGGGGEGQGEVCLIQNFRKPTGSYVEALP